MDKKYFKSNSFVTFVFLIIIAFFMLAILVRFFCSNVLYIDFGDSSASEQAADEQSVSDVDWEKLYPFSDSLKFIYSKTTDEQTNDANKENKYESTVNSIKSNIDYYSANLLFGRMYFVEANANFNKLIGMNIVTGSDSVIVMKNGYLTYQSYETDTTYAAESTVWLKNLLEDKGINFLYVQYPSKENKNDEQLPDGVTDYYNINADNLLEKLNSENVQTLDLRPLLNSESSDWYPGFFKTDHHWKPETGVWAAGEIATFLNNKYGYGLNESIGDISNYNVDVYEDYCLGSEGKKATLKFADPEDISLVYPKSTTSFTAGYNGNDSISGSFEDVLLDKSVFDKIDYYNISTYSSYLYGNKALVTIHNNNVSNGKRILVIGDSFNASVVPYLAQDVEYIDKLDLRYFSGSTMSYIEKTNPDTVIVAYNPSLISSDTTTSSVFNFE